MGLGWRGWLGWVPGVCAPAGPLIGLGCLAVPGVVGGRWMLPVVWCLARMARAGNSGRACWCGLRAVVWAVGGGRWLFGDCAAGGGLSCPLLFRCRRGVVVGVVRWVPVAFFSWRLMRVVAGPVCLTVAVFCGCVVRVTGGCGVSGVALGLRWLWWR